MKKMSEQKVQVIVTLSLSALARQGRDRSKSDARFPRVRFRSRQVGAGKAQSDIKSLDYAPNNKLGAKI